MIRTFQPIQQIILRGDRLYARLCVNGEKVLDFFIEGVREVKDIMVEVRRRVKGRLGLSQLYIRNLTQGWSRECLYMLR